MEFSFSLKKNTSYCESLFFRLPKKTRIYLKNRLAREIGGKITVFDWGQGNRLVRQRLVSVIGGESRFHCSLISLSIYLETNRAVYIKNEIIMIDSKV